MQKKIVKRIKKKSQEQEKKVASDLGGKVLPGSGAIDGLKGDSRTSERTGGSFADLDFLVENKFTESDGYALSLSTWEKVKKEALRDGMRIPIMQIDIEPSPYEKHSIVVQEIDPDFNHLPMGRYIQAKRSKLINKDVVPSRDDRTIIHFANKEIALEVIDYEVFLDVKFPKARKKNQEPAPVEEERPKTGKELAKEIVW